MVSGRVLVDLTSLSDIRRRDDYDGELKVFDMSWFITKGSPVTEDRAFIRKYHKVWKVSDGPRQTVAQDILMYADPDDKGAPIYKDGADVKHLARLTADLSCIPVGELTQKMGRRPDVLCHLL